MKRDEDGLMEKNKIPWVIGLLIFGLSALIISFWIDKRMHRDLEAQSQIGRVEKLYGQVSTFRAGSNQKRTVGQLEFLSSLDSVETADQSEARVSMDNSAVLKILPESLVTFERTEMVDGYQDVLVLQRGEIRIEEPGRSGEFFISKNGQRVAAEQYHQLSISKEPVARPAPVETSVTESHSGLSDDEINSLVSAQRPNFMKCYTGLLQKDPQAKGELSLNFTIENSGKVGLIEVSSARLQNEDFKRCLSQVLTRVQFRSFSGSAISTFFPLKFE